MWRNGFFAVVKILVLFYVISSICPILSVKKDYEMYVDDAAIMAQIITTNQVKI